MNNRTTHNNRYNDSCAGVQSPRLPNYNYTNDGFHELVRSQPPLSFADEILIDDAARRRCQTLLSVDDANAALVQALQDVGRFNNTYFVVSSDHGYNLGQHRIPTNKFLLYEHSARIPGVVRGPGVRGGNNSVLGTNVDYAPTWLAMAGIPTPPTYDGRSVLAQLVPQELEHELPAPTLARVRADRAELAQRPWRTEQFLQYYNQGGPSPWAPGSCPQTPGQFMPCEGWAPGSSSSPSQPPADLNEPRFPRDEGLVATVRPLDSYSNTYIGLAVVDSTLGSGRYKCACVRASGWAGGRRRGRRAVEGVEEGAGVGACTHTCVKEWPPVPFTRFAHAAVVVVVVPVSALLPLLLHRRWRVPIRVQPRTNRQQGLFLRRGSLSAVRPGGRSVRFATPVCASVCEPAYDAHT